MAYTPILASAILAAVVLLAPFITRFIKDHHGLHAFNVGISISYIFVGVFPHIAMWQKKLMDSHVVYHQQLANLLFVIALAGFVATLGLILNANRHQASESQNPFLGLSERNNAALIISLAVYCFMVGYIFSLPRMESLIELSLLTLAMIAHFAGLTILLREQSADIYDRQARYVLAVALVAGVLVGGNEGFLLPYRAAPYAYVSGTVIVLGTAYELPKLKRYGDFPHFVAGAVAFAVVIQLVGLD